MGDMADDYDGWDVDDFKIVVSPKEARESQIWVTKDGREMLVKNMANDHLFNAYMMSGADYLFKEMVYRTFEKHME
jgi:hypothetical protein